MKRYLFMAALAAILALAPATVTSYAYAEEEYSDVESDVGLDAGLGEEQQLNNQEQSQWDAEEPAETDNTNAYDSGAEEN